MNLKFVIIELQLIAIRGKFFSFDFSGVPSKLTLIALNANNSKVLLNVRVSLTRERYHVVKMTPRTTIFRVSLNNKHVHRPNFSAAVSQVS